MADKMMRIAGRGGDGKSKALRVDNTGRLSISNEAETRSLLEGDLTISPNATKKIEIRHVFNSFVISGRLTKNIDEIDIYIESGLFGSSLPDRKRKIYDVTGGRFVTDVFNAKSDRVNVSIKNIGTTDITLTHLNITATGFSAGTSDKQDILTAKDMEGNDINLTAVKDNEGKGVLRVVNAAPHAYDEGTDSLRVLTTPLNEENIKIISALYEKSIPTGDYLPIVPPNHPSEAKYTHLSLSLNMPTSKFKVQITFGYSGVKRRRRITFLGDNLKTIEATIQPDEIEEDAYFLPKIPIMGSVFDVRVYNTSGNIINTGEIELIAHRGGF